MKLSAALLLPFVVHASENLAIDGSSGWIANKHDAVNERHGGSSLSIPTSPECWRSAVEALDYLRGDSTVSLKSSVLCAQLTSDDQRLLALELARCHMADAGRQLMRDLSTCESVEAALNAGGLQTCLRNLSDQGGFNTYTHFFTYVNQLCVRLLQESVAVSMEESSIRLVDSSSKADERMRSMLREMEMASQDHEVKLEAMRKQQAQLMESWSDQDKKRSELYDRQLRDVQAHASEALVDLYRMQNMWKADQEVWSAHVREQQNNYTSEMLRQKTEIQEISDAVTNTNSFFRPWIVWGHSMCAFLSASYSSLMRAGAICAAVLFSFFLSIPRRIRHLRWYLFLVIAAWALLEWATETYECLAWMDDSEIMPLVRQAFPCVLCCWYLLGVVHALFWRRSGTEDLDDNEVHGVMPGCWKWPDPHPHGGNTSRSGLGDQRSVRVGGHHSPSLVSVQSGDRHRFYHQPSPFPSHSFGHDFAMTMGRSREGMLNNALVEQRMEMDRRQELVGMNLSNTTAFPGSQLGIGRGMEEIAESRITQQLVEVGGDQTAGFLGPRSCARNYQERFPSVLHAGQVHQNLLPTGGITNNPRQVQMNTVSPAPADNPPCTAPMEELITNDVATATKDQPDKRGLNGKRKRNDGDEDVDEGEADYSEDGRAGNESTAKKLKGHQ